MDSNHRRRSQRVYSPSPLATRAHPHVGTLYVHLSRYIRCVIRLKNHGQMAQAGTKFTARKTPCQHFTRCRAYLFFSECSKFSTKLLCSILGRFWSRSEYARFRSERLSIMKYGPFSIISRWQRRSCGARSRYYRSRSRHFPFIFTRFTGNRKIYVTRF